MFLTAKSNEYKINEASLDRLSEEGWELVATMSWMDVFKPIEIANTVTLILRKEVQ